MLEGRVGVVGPTRARGKGGDSLGDRSQGAYAAGSARVAILALPPLGGTTLVGGLGQTSEYDTLQVLGDARADPRRGLDRVAGVGDQQGDPPVGNKRRP